jgi:hypothetical protein
VVATAPENRLSFRRNERVRQRKLDKQIHQQGDPTDFERKYDPNHHSGPYALNSFFSAPDIPLVAVRLYQFSWLKLLPRFGWSMPSISRSFPRVRTLRIEPTAAWHSGRMNEAIARWPQQQGL